MKIKNLRIYGLGESCIRSGYPMQTREPSDLDDGNYGTFKVDPESIEPYP